jgi:phage shock protein A
LVEEVAEFMEDGADFIVGEKGGFVIERRSHVAADEAEVEASDVLVDPKKADIEERFRKLERGETTDSLDDELAAMKNRLKGR